MPKTAVETAVCDICGAEVRGGSLFCYNCGGSLSKAEKTADGADAVETPSPTLGSIEPNGNGVRETPHAPAKPRAEKANRKRVRASNRQPVEIVWEPRTGVSWPFIVVSLIFVLLSIVIVIASFYIR